MKKFLFLGILSISLSLLSCATMKPTDPRDPYEGYNRKVFSFNQKVDRTIVRPMAQIYHNVLPPFLLKGFNNFFNNLEEIPTVVNEILQFKIELAWGDFWRFGINSTVGILGFFDVSTRLGLEHHYQDFGLTLAKYGYKNSNYFVIPFIGPSTVRDTIAYPIQYSTITVYPYIDPKSARYSLIALNLISDRAQLLNLDKISDGALDPYVFIRDAYLQKRKYLISGESNDTEDIYENAIKS